MDVEWIGLLGPTWIFTINHTVTIKKRIVLGKMHFSLVAYFCSIATSRPKITEMSVLLPTRHSRHPQMLLELLSKATQRTLLVREGYLQTPPNCTNIFIIIVALLFFGKHFFISGGNYVGGGERQPPDQLQQGGGAGHLVPQASQAV